MTFKPPFGPDDMMKMFDPDAIAKMFDPKSMMAIFEPQKSKGFDLSGVMESNRRNFEAMRAATEAAAEAGRSFHEKQMAVFREIIEGANEQIRSLGSSSGPEIAQKQMQIYGAAVEKSLLIMTELAEAAHRANEEAFASVQDRVKQAIEDLKRF